jgi:putative PEP-CTERM system histidine kinase
MMAIIAFWGHAIAALGFGLLAVFEGQRARRGAQGWALIAACAVTALWAMVAAGLGGEAVLSGHVESARNLVWLGFMLLLLRQGAGAGATRTPMMPVYGALVFVLMAQTALAFLPPWLVRGENAAGAILDAGFVLRMIFAAGALLAVHNLYIAVQADARGGIGLPMAALAAMWAYDLNLYTLSYIAHDWVASLVSARGFAVALLAPVIALGARRNRHWRINLSRKVAFRSLPLVATAAYLLAMLAASALFEALGAADAQAVQIAFLIMATIAAIVILPSARARGWLRVMAAKHLFAHRFDYRTEWLRFTDTIGRPGETPAPLQTRVVKAIADIVEAPAGLLLLPEVDGLVTKAGWNRDAATQAPNARLSALLETGRIISLDQLRRADADMDEAGAVPEWMLADRDAWAIVPLIHFDRLAGAVLIDRPAVARTLDWEDFDLLRVAGRQVASYLAEAQGQDALSEAQRFDEFNRRFAFIMHDIKNLVSQLGLVARNAERHADNPEFRKDMIATLHASTARMNDLLAKLAQHNKARPEEPRAIGLAQVVNAVAVTKREGHPVVVSGNPALLAIADPARLETALAHLVQNAIEASAANEPVTMTMVRSDHETGVEVTDTGAGMTPDFIAGQLFRPFASTKENGFGVGAYEARALVAAMGGRIAVKSAPGEGSSFTIWLRGATGWAEERAA